MEIELGSIIKIICSNNLIESGTVIEYTKNQLVLELVDHAIFIVQDPFKNIIAIKIMSGIKPREIEEVLVDEELKPDAYYPKEQLRAMRLADLHKLKAAEERKRARELLQSHKLNHLPEVQFGQPNFSQSVFKYPKKKT
jgi:hypothetical protein